MKTRISTHTLARLGLLAGLSILLMLVVRFPILPAATYLEYDPADVPILFATFLYGPLAGLGVTLVVSLIQALTVSAASTYIGFLMHIFATGTLVIVSGVIYRLSKNRRAASRKAGILWAAIALVAGSVAMTLVMIPLNLIFIPLYGIPYEMVVDMIVPVVLPFNLIKAFGNSLLCFLLYKQVGKLLRR